MTGRFDNEQWPNFYPALAEWPETRPNIDQNNSPRYVGQSNCASPRTQIAIAALIAEDNAQCSQNMGTFWPANVLTSKRAQWKAAAEKKAGEEAAAAKKKADEETAAKKAKEEAAAKNKADKEAAKPQAKEKLVAQLKTAMTYCSAASKQQNLADALKKAKMAHGVLSDAMTTIADLE